MYSTQLCSHTISPFEQNLCLLLIWSISLLLQHDHFEQQNVKEYIHPTQYIQINLYYTVMYSNQLCSYTNSPFQQHWCVLLIRSIPLLLQHDHFEQQDVKECVHPTQYIQINLCGTVMYNNQLWLDLQKGVLYTQL